MNLSISVMAHPSREKFFDYLKERLGDIPFSIDTSGIGVWENCKRAWMMADRSADYHVVIQDDAIVCENFKERAIEEIIKSGGDKALSFYFGRRGNMIEMSQEGLKNGHIILPGVRWGLAICMRTELIEDMIKFAERLNTPKDDARISRFLTNRGIKTYYPIPSLIDHRPHEEAESLVGDVGKGRVAYKFIDENKRGNKI